MHINQTHFQIYTFQNTTKVTVKYMHLKCTQMRNPNFLYIIQDSLKLFFQL